MKKINEKNKKKVVFKNWVESFFTPFLTYYKYFKKRQQVILLKKKKKNEGKLPGFL